MAFLVGIIAGAIGLLAFLPYISDTIKGRTVPNKASWIIWAVLGAVIAASYLASGGGDSAWVPIVYAIGIAIVAALSIRHGTSGWSALDKICLAGAGAGMLIWWVTNDPALALYLTISVDAIGAIPTIMKAWKEPQSESRNAWAMFFLANTLNLFAIERLDLSALSYPVYVFLLSLVMNILILRRK